MREGYGVNLPERTVPGAGPVEPLVAVDNDAVVVTAVKLADDGSGDVVVRFHEACGGRARARLMLGFATQEVTATDLLERPLGEMELTEGLVEVTLRPFELRTLRFRRP